MKTTGFPADRMAEMQAAFEAFKKEALQRKKTVKTSQPERIYSQGNVIVEFMGELLTREIGIVPLDTGKFSMPIFHIHFP